MTSSREQFLELQQQEALQQHSRQQQERIDNLMYMRGLDGKPNNDKDNNHLITTKNTDNGN